MRRNGDNNIEFRLSSLTKLRYEVCVPKHFNEKHSATTDGRLNSR